MYVSMFILRIHELAYTCTYLTVALLKEFTARGYKREHACTCMHTQTQTEDPPNTHVLPHRTHVLPAVCARVPV